MFTFVFVFVFVCGGGGRSNSSSSSSSDGWGNSGGGFCRNLRADDSSQAIARMEHLLGDFGTHLSMARRSLVSLKRR